MRKQSLVALVVALSVAAAGILILLGIFGSKLTAVQAQGTIRYVTVGGSDSGNDCSDRSFPCATIQHAVDMANAGDEIRVAAGTYTGVTSRLAPLGYSSYYNLTTVTQTVYISKSVTIRGGYTTTNWDTSYPLVQPSTLDAQGKGRVLFIVGDITPTIENLRITGGDATGLSAGSIETAGGGVYLDQSAATISNCQVFSNTSGDAFGFGGGIYLRGSAAMIEGNAIYSNTAHIGGGLCTSFDTAMIYGNAIYLNTAYANAVYTDIVGSGGRIFLFFSNATVKDNTVYSNTADEGGGLYLRNSSNAVISENTVYTNAADADGGGLYLYRSNATLINSIIVDNQADVRGNGLYMYNSSPDLLHATVARNSGGDGSGIYIAGTSNVNLANIIVSSHITGILCESSSAANVNGVLWNTNITNYSGGSVIVANATVGDPAFVDPDKGDYHIGSTSTAIDRVGSAGIYIDRDGVSRPQGTAYDLGAYEFPQVTLSLTKTVSDSSPEPDQLITFTIVVYNSGGPGANATNALIYDGLPSGLVFAGGSIELDPPGAGTVGTIPPTLASGLAIDAGDRITITFAATVNGGRGTVINNTATVTSAEVITPCVGSVEVTVAKVHIYLPLVLRKR